MIAQRRVDPHLSEVRRRAGSIGGRVTAMRALGKPGGGARDALTAYRRRFEDGTHTCALGCEPIAMPADPVKRQKVVRQAIALHMQRMRSARGKAR